MFRVVCSTLVLFVFALCAHSASATAVELTDAIVHLKNGITVRGTIVSLIPRVSVTIRLSDGELMEIPTYEIQEMKRDTVEIPQQYPIYGRSNKSPGLALALSFLVPGVGQFYNEQFGKGILFLSGNFISTGLIVVGADSYEDGLILAGLGVMTFNWLASMIDGYASAKSINNNNRRLSFAPIYYDNRIGGAIAFRF